MGAKLYVNQMILRKEVEDGKRTKKFITNLYRINCSYI